jgi:type IV pilus assembly protein PilY1
VENGYGSTSNPKPLYQGLSSQPITAQPVVTRNPVMSTNSGTQPNVLVLFGTGRLINTLDKANTDMQSFYGIWDSGEDRLTRRDLVRQTYTTTGAFRVMTDNPVPYGASHSNAVRYGWMIDFTGGERILSVASIVNVPITAAEFEPLVIFNTYAPDTSDQLCQFGGSATTMLVKVENGGQPTIPIIDTNNDNQITPLDNWNNQVVSGITITNTLPSQPIIRGDYLFIPLSEGKVMKIKIMNSGYPLGRWSWNLMKQAL